ncbi:hypothetical protein GCM10011380_36260 [Sphingomonas metalli]|uniref:Uncharacterized protein n=1 Tax=Sphingomonas metalli TaxID=1779358 RepID=A0A916TGY3_9SPHN|nr:hypothetical protein [Sphingomonas metalli]GGB43569.1 hypothetical protein GCM10011380_36260 [Sphingomonas metalli]
MRSLVNFLAGLMLVFSLQTTAMAHALERTNVSVSAQAPIATQIAEGHTPGDADQVPADGDKGYPHHHGGCHGHQFAQPVKFASATWTPGVRQTTLSEVRTVLPRSTADPALRPPQA